jgi:hypothetical protein
MRPFLSGVHDTESAHRYATSVSSSASEVLVELTPGAAVEEAIPSEAQILQRLPPRLAIVATDEEGIRALERSPGISAVYAEDVPEEAMERFDEVSRAFAGGWNERRRPKVRRGEELPWDAPGFDPPR